MSINLSLFLRQFNLMQRRYVDVILNLIRLAGDYVSEEVHVVPFFRSWWSIVHSLALSNPFYHFNLCIYDRTNFLLFLLHLDSLSTTISIYPINHAFHIQNTVHLISYQVWYRVIQIVINRDDVQVHFRNVHVLWYEYKVKFVPDMWLSCFHSHWKFTHQK